MNAQPRELSIVKIADFSGKDDEDPHEWMDSFERAAAANQWAQDVRKLAIVTGYMKDAAAAWATAAMAAGANNQITGFSGNLAATDFKDRFLEKFTPDSKQNKWYYKLSTIRQRAEESVDEYSLRFQRLLRKVNRTVNNIQTIPPQLQVRMYLCGLNSLITPLVSISDPADLGAAIDHARTVETGYNFKTPLGKSDTKDEVDELTKKIEQLTLNYATIASALAVQPASNQQRQNRGQTSSRFSRTRTNNNDRTCYNCHQLRHIARNCRQPRRNSQRTQFSNTRNRDVHYVDFQEEDYDYYENYSGDDDDNERDLYQYESEVYPITRSGQRYIPNRTNTFNRRPIVDELDEVQRNTNYNAQPRRPSYNSESEKESAKTTFSSGPKRRSKISPAPIESLTAFDVSNYLQNLDSGLTVGQAAYLSPRYRAELSRAVRRSYKKEGEKEANFVESDEDNTTTAAKVTLRINGRAQTAIVDSGAATSIITKALLNKLDCRIDRPSKLIVVTANGARTKSLGIVSNLLVTIGKINISTSFQVLESKDEVLILGNEWLREANAIMD